MTSRIRSRIEAESDAIAARDRLRAELAARELPPLAFAVAWIGSGHPGDSGGASGEWRVFLDAEAAGVDPGRVRVQARIDPETGIAALDKFSWRAWTPDVRAAYLEWMRGWYG